MPEYVHISEAKLHDSKILPKLKLNPGSIVAMDRAYNAYKQFAEWIEADTNFVTRMKSTTQYDVVEERAVPPHRNVLSDEIIVFANLDAKEKCPYQPRRIVVWDEEKQREIVLLTNHLDFGSTTIFDIYKER